MLQSVLRFLKDKVLIVALFVLGFLCIFQYVHYHNLPPREVVRLQLVPTQITHENGMEHAKVQETVIKDKQQMKELTKQDKKELHAKRVTSSTEFVDHNSITMRDDTVKLRHYDTKKWFLAPTVHNIDITHTDTAVHSTFAQSVTYKDPNTMLVFGPYIGYDVLHNNVAFGLSVTFNVFSIKYRR